MNAHDVPHRIAELSDLIAIKEEELAHKINRRIQISEKPNSSLKQKIITRYKTEIMQLTDELNNLKTELWGLQEMNLSDAPCVW